MRMTNVPRHRPPKNRWKILADIAYVRLVYGTVDGGNWRKIPTDFVVCSSMSDIKHIKTIYFCSWTRTIMPNRVQIPGVNPIRIFFSTEWGAGEWLSLFLALEVKGAGGSEVDFHLFIVSNRGECQLPGTFFEMRKYYF